MICRRRAFLLRPAPALGAVGAALLLLIGAAGTARSDLMGDTSPQHEVDLGREVAREVELVNPVSRDKLLQQRADRVGQALVEQLDRKVYPYQFRVLALSEYNAFALPGGFVYLNEGLLGYTPSDDALAFVIAHEIAHVSHRHWAKQTDKMEGVLVLSEIAGAAIGGSGGDFAAGLAAVLTWLKYSRDDEYEADAAAIEHIWRAGYDPAGAVAAMNEIIELEQGKSVPKYLRDHPPAKERLSRLETKLAELSSRPRPPLAAAASPPPTAPDPSEIVGKLPELDIAPNHYFPLSVGSSWTYLVQQGSDTKSSYRVQILGAVPAADGAVYRAEVAFGGTAAYCQFLTTPDAVWRRSLTGKECPWKIEHLLPAPDQRVVADGWEFTCLGTEKVVTPCGTFPDALKVRKRHQQSSSTIDTWFVPGIGMVKRLNAEAGVTEILSAYKVEPLPDEPAGHAAENRQ